MCGLLLQLLLARYSGQDDIVVGTPYANRAQAEVQQLAGCLVNTCALRTDVSGDPTFRELLRRAAQTTLQAFEHAHAPFAKVVDALRLDRSAAFNPVYQVGNYLCSRDRPHVTVLRFWQTTAACLTSVTLCRLFICPAHVCSMLVQVSQYLNIGFLFGRCC